MRWGSNGKDKIQKTGSPMLKIKTAFRAEIKTADFERIRYKGQYIRDLVDVLTETCGEE